MTHKLLSMVLVGWLLSASAQAAQTWKVNLKDADISALVSEVAEITGKNFIVDPRVKGNITVISSTALTADQVYELFLGVLDVNGFAAVQSGKAVKILPDMNAKSNGVRVDVSGSTRGEDMVTRVVMLDATNAIDMVPVLRPMMPQFAHLAAVPNTNALIISDRADNIAALVEIIHQLDSGINDETEVIQLKDSRVADVLNLLEALTPVSTGSKDNKGFARVRVVADERTNRLVIRGDAKSRKRVHELVATLDAPTQHIGNVEVFRLRFAAAKQVADVLKGMVSGVAGSASSSTSSTTTGTTGTSKESADKLSGPASIMADETQNVVVVRADANVMREVQSVIKQLDMRRAQVLIQAAIVEVSGSKGKQLGIQWAAGNRNGPVGTISFSDTGVSINEVIAGIVSKNPVTSVPDGASFGVGKMNGDSSLYGALVQALATASNTNLLSAPTLMTLDNQEAKIVVGQNVPFITGQSTGAAAGTSNPFTTIERKDVGITLKVIPHVSEGNVVRLEVDQEVSQVVPATTGVKAADLITNTRAIKSTILADDQQTIILGGLMEDDTTQSQSKVPLLGDIPLIGWLFRASSDTSQKRNLLVFLRPTILRDDSKLASLSKRHYDAVRMMQVGVWKDKVEVLPANIDDVYQGGGTPSESKKP